MACLVQILAVFTVQLGNICCLEGTSDCSIKKSQTADGFDVDCSHRHLTSVPIGLPRHSIHLDLSLNNLTSLGQGAFSGVPVIVSLNLTRANIHRLHVRTFSDLNYLENLYISQNPILQSPQLPEYLFMPLTRLETLHMWNEISPTSFQILRNLTSLKTLALTCNGSLPEEISSLYNLRVLSIVFGRIVNLTREILQPVAMLKLIELSFHNTKMIDIEDGVFDDFTSLRLLNFACNDKLAFTKVIDSISTSTNSNISDLVLDLVGSSKGAVVGPDDYPHCRPAWANLRRVTARAIGPIWVTKPERFLKCISSLQVVSIASNSYIMDIPSIPLGFRDIITASHILSVDISHTFAAGNKYRERIQLSCDPTSNWIPENRDRFPPVIDRPHGCMDQKITVPDVPIDACPDALVYYVPPCGTYINGENILTTRLERDECTVVSTNNIKYINYSGLIGHRPGKLGKAFYGLTKVEFLNITNIGATNIDAGYFATMPSLKTLLLGNNFLVQPDLAFLFGLKKLEILDLSNNQFTKMTYDALSTLEALKHLDLSFNKLDNDTFLLNSSTLLSSLNISHNKFYGLSEEVTAWFDHLPQLSILVLDSNPFLCTCHSLKFMQWIRTTKIGIQDREKLECFFDDKKFNISDVLQLDDFHAKCNLRTLKISISSSVMVITLLFITVLLVTYRLRWKIRWRYYKMRYEKRHKVNRLLDDGSLSTFNAYVIFSMDDEHVRPWVAHTLYPKVESEWQNGPLYLPGLRDDMPGAANIDNITDGIMASNLALWAITPAFFRDSHCETAAHFAFHHLGANRNLLLIMDNRFENYNVPKHFVNLLDRRNGIPKITYCEEDEDSERLFWCRLREFLSSGIED